MSWIVDTCVVLDVLEGDPEFGLPSARLLDKLVGEGLTLCPVSYIELAPAFSGDLGRQNEFLSGVGIDYSQPWAWNDTKEANRAWNCYVSKRRSDRIAKRPVADILIGAFALRRKGLVTRNENDFRPFFANLPIITP